ncbi:MAG: LURP-one-related family protein [Bacillota bacterium]|nr:LURP-one-related family protein [Bacillota bacterium]
MKLYVKEKAISVMDKFFVRDEDGKKKYEIKKKFGPSIGLKLHIFDMDGNELAYIKEKNISVKPKFRIYIDGEHTATITKKIVSLKPKYEVEELGWKIKGNIFEHNYKIVGDKGEAMNIHKGRFKLSDSFELEFSDKKHVLEALAVVLAIDCVMDEEEE